MQYILFALLSAILFGGSTPIRKVLLESLPPFQLAGLLYIGAALGVLPFSMRRSNAKKVHRIGKGNILRLFSIRIVMVGLLVKKRRSWVLRDLQQ